MVIYNLELESADVHDECAKMADSSEEDAAVAAYFLLNLRKKRRENAVDCCGPFLDITEVCRVLCNWRHL